MANRDPHSDNDLIDNMKDQSGGGSSAQGASSGGNLARDIGSRSEERTVQGTLEGDEVDRAKGSDNPAQDELKGDKTIAAMPTSRG